MNQRMIAINKAEKDAISRRFPDVHIVRTMKQKSKRHHYYCEETRQVMRFLKQLRDPEGFKNSGRKDGRNADRKTKWRERS